MQLSSLRFPVLLESPLCPPSLLDYASHLSNALCSFFRKTFLAQDRVPIRPYLVGNRQRFDDVLVLDSELTRACRSPDSVQDISD